MMAQIQTLDSLEALTAADSPSSIISLFDDDESRWQAVVTRNSNADGFFVYGVKTTKIFCRPICKARLARRANIRFYDGGAAAAQAGFRPCKRCKPEVAGFMPEEAAVRKIRGFVLSRIHEESGSVGGSSGGREGMGMLSLSQMAAQTGLSKWHFHRVFKKCVGVTPAEYLREQRWVRRGAPVDWLEGLDGEALETGSDFDLGWLEQPVVEGAAPDAESTPSSLSSDPSLWTMDDFVT